MKRLVKLFATAVFTLLVVFSAVMPVQASNQQFLNSQTTTTTVKATSTKKAGWKKSGKKWMYRKSNGKYVKNAWQKVSGKWYHFDKKGYMQTGWLKDAKKWYYLGSNGAMVTGWKKISGKEYYFNSKGIMQTNKWIGNYYVDANGVYTMKKTPTANTAASAKTVGTKVGSLTIADAGYRVNLYDGSASLYQAIVDQENSALLTDSYGKQMIADHAGQGFRVLRADQNALTLNKSTATITTTNGVTKTYKLVKRYSNAINTGYGIKVDGKYVEDIMGSAEVFMYCCNDSTGTSVTVTFWKEIKN